MRLPRLLLFTAVFASAAACTAQVEEPAPGRTQPPPKQRDDSERQQQLERDRARIDRYGGNPESILHPGDPQPFQDTALTSLVLDPAQAERIQKMDRHYVEEIGRMDIVDRNDPRYRQLWLRRADEIKTILTPVQYERWKQLNAGHLERISDPMPIARPDSTHPTMPVMSVDTLHDDMPSGPPVRKP